MLNNGPDRALKLEELNIEDIWVFIHVLMQMKSVLSKAAHQLRSKKEW